MSEMQFEKLARMLFEVENCLLEKKLRKRNFFFGFSNKYKKLRKTFFFKSSNRFFSHKTSNQKLHIF